MPFRRVKVHIPEGVKVGKNKVAFIKDFIDIFSFNIGKEGTIFPSKGKVMMEVSVIVPREFKGRTGHFNQIVSSFVRSREIIVLGDIFLDDKLVMFHDAFNAFASP